MRSQFLVDCSVTPDLPSPNLLLLFAAPPSAMRVHPAALTHAASGSFTSLEDPPAFDPPSSHPVLKMVDGPADTRKNLLLFSSYVEAILFVANGKLHVLNMPQQAYDTSVDPDELDPLIVGALGNNCSSATPVGLPLRKALADFLFLHSPQDAEHPVFYSSG